MSIGRFMLSATFANAHPWSVGNELILSFGPENLRFAALVKVKDETGAATKFMRQSPWRPVNTRAFPRFDIEAMVAIRTPAEVEMFGWTSNVSFGGLAIRLDDHLEAETVSIRMGSLEPMEATVIAPDQNAPADGITRLKFVEPSEDRLWDLESFILARTPNPDVAAA